MTTWRERIAAARQAGGVFTHEDHRRATDTTHCAAGETVAALGLSPIEAYRLGWDELWREPYGHRFFLAIVRNQPDEAEHALERVEDRALELKRERPVA